MPMTQLRAGQFMQLHEFGLDIFVCRAQDWEALSRDVRDLGPWRTHVAKGLLVALAVSTAPEGLDDLGTGAELCSLMAMLATPATN
jgi:hypothetical protein